MKKYFGSFLYWLAVAAIMVALSGCGAADSGEGEPSTSATQPETGQPVAPASPPEPVQLQLYANQPLNEEDFNLLIAEPLKAKYPHITVQLKPNASWSQFQAALTAGDPIDLFTFFHGNWGNILDMDLAEDLTPLMTARKYDFNRLDRGALQALQDLTGGKQLPGLPYHMQFNALYYNKDIFDKFGVAYPTDGMTWEEAIALGRSLTRNVDGVQYQGLGVNVWTRLTLQRGLLPIDFETKKSQVTSESFRTAMTILKQMYSVPGMTPRPTADFFLKERTQAMIGEVSNMMFNLIQTDMNWDLAQYPSFADKRNTFTQYDLHVMGISKTSKHKQAAMDVLELLMTDEVQKLSTGKTGRLAPLSDPIFQTYFAADNAALKGKRLSSIFKSKPMSPSEPFTKWHSKSYEIANKYVTEFLQDKKDMNTALREADEEINQWIAANP